MVVRQCNGQEKVEMQLAMENILCEMEHWVDMILKFPIKIVSMMMEMMMQYDIF